MIENKLKLFKIFVFLMTTFYINDLMGFTIKNQMRQTSFKDPFNEF